MHIIKIGSTGRGVSGDISLNCDRVTATIIPPSASQPRTQYCIELAGGGDVAKIYATNFAAFENLQHDLAANNVNTRLVPGLEVLGVHIHHKPGGWDAETPGRVTERRAPSDVCATALGGMPEKPGPLYPFPKEAGIEVFGDDRLNHQVFFLSYENLDAITLQKNTVGVTFAKVRDGVSRLLVVTANDMDAGRLATSIGRKTPRRLVINHVVIGITMFLAEGTILRAGCCAESPQDSASK